MQAILENNQVYRIPPENGRRSITAVMATGGAARWAPRAEVSYAGSVASTDGVEQLTDPTFGSGDDWNFPAGWATTFASHFVTYGPAIPSQSRVISAGGSESLVPNAAAAALAGGGVGSRVLISVTVASVASSAGVFRLQYGEEFMDFPGNVPGLYQKIVSAQNADVTIYPLGGGVACTKLTQVSLIKITAEIGIPFVAGVPQTLPADAYIAAGADDTTIDWVSNY